MRDGLSLGWRLRALAAASVIPPALGLVSFARLSRLLGRNPASTAPGLDPAALAAWVDRVLNNLPGPWRNTCLKRSAVLYHLLRRAGHSVELCIGVRRDHAGTLAAHAWLVQAGQPYLEAPGTQVAAHQVIACFPEDHPS